MAPLLRRLRKGCRQAESGLQPPPNPIPGTYWCSDRELYRIEDLSRDHVLVEECRTGTLLDVPRTYLANLRQVRPARGLRAA